MLDGEMIVQGRSWSIEAQKALRSRRASLLYYVFDLLHLDGKTFTRRKSASCGAL
jgi:ATP-dependent DNA ligase